MPYVITVDGYSIVNQKKQNQLVIYLPPTYATATNTFIPIGNRKVDLTDEELLDILEYVKSIFKEE